MNEAITQATSGSATAQPETLIQRLEGYFAKFDALAPLLEKIAAIVPGGQVAAGIVTAVDQVGEFAVSEINGSGQTDAAQLAATNISESTGNASLDARLVAIENWIEGAGSFLAFVGKELGMSASVPPTPAQAAPVVAPVTQANSAAA